MALFSKPTIKKPQMPKPEARPASDGATTRSVPRNALRPPSAREVAVEAQGRRLGTESPQAEPHADISVLGESLIEWSPPGSSIEVGQANPGLCAVLENAALLYASGQKDTARRILDQGVESDHETNRSPLAWLALFDLLQRANDRVAFEQLALRYVVQFERSAPAWEEGLKTTAGPKAVAGGYIPVTGKLSAASAAQLDVVKSAIQKKVPHARLDLAFGVRLRRRRRAPAGRCAGACAQASLHADVAATRKAEARRGRDRQEGPGGRRGRVAPLARTAAIRAEAGGLRRSRDRVCDRLRAVAAVVGAPAAAGEPRRGTRRWRRDRQARR